MEAWPKNPETEISKSIQENNLGDVEIMTDKKVPVWDGVLKCETCKLETCENFQDIQDVSGIDCGECEEYERDILKTVKWYLNRPFRKILLRVRILNYLQKKGHWTLAEKFKWILRRF